MAVHVGPTPGVSCISHCPPADGQGRPGSKGIPFWAVSVWPITSALCFADYTSSVATKYLKRGFRAATSSKGLYVLLLPIAVSMALELANMAQKGELQRLWTMAKQTDLTFNLVSSPGQAAPTISASANGGGAAQQRAQRCSPHYLDMVFRNASPTALPCVFVPCRSAQWCVAVCCWVCW